MDTTSFKKLVAAHFSPNIRAMGWKGSGFHYRKLEENHVVRIFGIQGSWHGGSICCETAIHFDFLPDLVGKPFEKATYASCIIRERLSPKGEGDYHWYFSNDESNNLAHVKEIWEAFSTNGQRFYEDFAQFPEPFSSIQPSDFAIVTSSGAWNRPGFKLLGKYYIYNSIYLSWLLMHINKFIGEYSRANEFTELGMLLVQTHALEMAKRNRGKIDIQYIEWHNKLFGVS